ncbi:MAG: glycosyltransferase [Gammaproteobacteria bacterium]|nr:glycosyltransferase [Gammaproteobacteria bacterium]MDH5653336.1 glycosyltransferase [Gammaproteobacteria bacterium]
MTVDYSIIIPAYNEAAVLERTLREIKTAMAAVPFKGEIVVCDNNSTDRTSNIGYSAGAKVVFENRNQISRARNTGAKHAEGRYLIFVDADTIVPPALLQKALDNLAGGKTCGGGAHVKFDIDVTPGVTRVLNFWNWISSSFGLAAGCFIYCTRQDFKACGGFSNNVYASEEIWFSLALKYKARKTGRKFRIINLPKVITSARKLEWYSYRYQIGLLIMLTLFPFLVRSKKFCEYWYKRPGDKS